MTLWIYHLLRAGPPVILFAAGTRVPNTPHAFRDYESVLVTSWAREAQEVRAALHMHMSHPTPHRSAWRRCWSCSTTR